MAENSTLSLDASAVRSSTVPLTPSHTGVARAEFADPICDANWDALATAHPNCSFFHSSAWAKTLQGTYGFKPLYLTNKAGSGATGLLPLMEVNSWLTGRRGVALPFTDNCGPLCADEISARKLVESAFQLGKSRRWKFLEVRGGKQLFPECPASLAFYGHCVNLDQEPDRMFARLEGSVRRAIRKAEKSNVTVSISSELNAVKTFYTLQCQTRRKHGLPPQSFAFFQNIHEHILSKNLGVIVVASFQQRPVAASVYFRWGGQAVYKYGASDEKLQHLRGANLVMWEAIKWLAREGVSTLHLGRTSLWNEGLRRFKLGWGAGEEKIEYIKYDLRKDCFVTDTDGAHGWHNRAFRFMPAYCSRLLGKVLYRHWA